MTPPPDSADSPKWTTEQIVTASVHEAWLMSGKNESNFFNIVRALTAISTEKRGITLPESKGAGRRMGLYIKTRAKADPDQLLYAVVDQAVRRVGARSPVASGVK